MRINRYSLMTLFPKKSDRSSTIFYVSNWPYLLFPLD